MVSSRSIESGDRRRVLGKLRSAIDDDRLAGHVTAGVGGEEEHCFGDLLGFAEASERDLAPHALELLGCAELEESRGTHEAGLDAVHGDSLARELEARRADEAVETRLGRGVVTEARDRRAWPGN